MILANANADALLKADPLIEIGIAVLIFLACGLRILNFYLRYRKTGVKWTRKELLLSLAIFCIGIMFVLFSIGLHG
jgi:hypothetical protein